MAASLSARIVLPPLSSTFWIDKASAGPLVPSPDIDGGCQ
jgi:hypothetical protein